MIQKKRMFWNRGVLTVLAGLLVAGLLVPGTLNADEDARGYLGVSVDGLSDAEMKALGVTHGVLVDHVVEGEAAEKAGIMEGDVILFFNQEKIRRSSDLVDAVRDVSPGEKVTVRIMRKQKKMDLKVMVGKYEPKEFKWFGKKSIHLPSKVYLGVRLHRMNPELAAYFKVDPEAGVLVLSVEEESPAEKAGIKSGDVITGVNGKNVAGAGDIREILSDLEAGDEVTVAIVRHGKPKQVRASVAETKWGKGMNWIKGLKHHDFEFPEFHFNYDELSEKLKDKTKKFKKKASKRLSVTEESHSI